MCIANPAQIIEIDADRARVRYASDLEAHLAEVMRPAGMDVAAGDWVLIHGGMMIGTIPAGEVDALLELSRSLRPGPP